MAHLYTTRCVAAAIATCLTVFAQEAPSVRTGNTEIGGFVGASAGLDKYRIMGGGNVSHAVKRWLLPYFEYSYFPGLGRSYNLSSGPIEQVYSYTAPAHDIHAGVHFRKRLAESPFVIYSATGAGLLRSTFDGTGVVKVGNEPATSERLKQSFNGFAINFGGGLRWYTNDRFGFRLEAKAYRPTSGLWDNMFYKTEIGIFYQIH
jgi:hypothetical protein